MTAGTAITSFLGQQFAEAEVMPQLQANFHRSHPVWPLVARRYRLLGVGMHLDHDRVAALAWGLVEEAPPFLLTVLREPRARLLSRYKEWRSTPDEHMQSARDHVKKAILTARSDRLWAFMGAFYDQFQRTHTRAYLLDETSGQWEPHGVVVDSGFWPMQEPQRMNDGNWIMAGFRVARGFGHKSHAANELAVIPVDRLHVDDDDREMPQGR